MEIWKSINGFDNYEVSNLGNVRNIKTCRVLKVGLHKCGYVYLRLSENNTRSSLYIHRLVALAFIDNPDNHPVVNHIDGDKTNNKVSNLEWCTHSDNAIHAFKHSLRKSPKGEKCGKSKLTDLQVKEIRDKYSTGNFTYSQLGKEYNVDQSNIGLIIRFKTRA